MKKHIKDILAKIFWCVCMIAIVSACSSSDTVDDEERVPTVDDIAETLKNVNTEWGASKESVRKYMDGYQLVELKDENVLQFSAKMLPITIAYQFASDQLCAAVIMAKKGEEKIDVKKTVNNFNYVGETGSNEVFSNEVKNVCAVAYETTDNDEAYQIIGFTPLFPRTEKVNGVECTDLGLSVKWATCNVGAKSPGEYGGYYAWGETEEKTIYTWETYKYCAGSSKTCQDIGNDISKTEYDVAQSVLGKPWTMPTKGQMDELLAKCEWIWTEENGVNGYRVFGDNGNYIFLPASGYKSETLKSSGTYGYYVSATLEDGDIRAAHCLSFTSAKKLSEKTMRRYGSSVRAVIK